MGYGSNEFNVQSPTVVGPVPLDAPSRCHSLRRSSAALAGSRRAAGDSSGPPPTGPFAAA
jgi:hypothetical protein